MIMAEKWVRYLSCYSLLVEGKIRFCRIYGANEEIGPAFCDYRSYAG